MQRVDEGCKIQPWQPPRRSTLGAVLGQPLHSFTSASGCLSWTFPCFLWLWPSLSQLVSFLYPFHSYPRRRCDFHTEDPCTCKDELNFFRRLNYFCFESKSRSFTSEKELELFKPIFQQLQVPVIFSNTVLSRAWRRGSWRDREERICLRLQKELIWLHVLTIIWTFFNIFSGHFIKISVFLFSAEC